jgi:ferredoxin-NADP reductase
MTSHDEAELTLTVSTRFNVAAGAAVLELVSPDGADLPAWQPGAHIDLLLPEGLTRQYSLCGDPADRSSWKIAVLLEADGRGGSRAIHERITEGATVSVRGPRNHFELEAAQRYIFIAGGIGITPLIPMIAQAQESGAEWTLHYLGRSRSTMAFLDDLVSLYGDKIRSYPRDEVARPDLGDLLGEATADGLIYCCGPAGLLDAVTDATSQWPNSALRTERFTAKEVGVPVLSTSFDVYLSRSNKTITVAPEQSILEALGDAGMRILSSCGEGTCGTCETAVLEGTVDHRDSLLTPEEQAANDTMMICVSRASCPRLVLDI